jgi:glutaredoxin
MASENEATIEVFEKAGCPYSRALKRKLARDKVPYVEHDVERDPATLRRMLELNGGRRAVPTIVAGGEVQVGFHGS